MPYVAGMNVTNLATNTFSVSNSFAKCNIYGEADTDFIGTSEYTLIMWCSSMTAFGGIDHTPTSIPPSDKLGGLVIKQVKASDLDSAWIQRKIFSNNQSAFTMLETYGSDMQGFSAGGFVWASEATLNIITPAATLVGSYFRGTLQMGQLPPDGQDALSLR